MAERADAVTHGIAWSDEVGALIVRAIMNEAPEMRATFLVALMDHLVLYLRMHGMGEVLDEAAELTEIDVYGYAGGATTPVIVGQPHSGRPN